MAKFRIEETKIASSGDGSIFRVTWLGTPLQAGQLFEVYDAGHWWRIPVTTFKAIPGGAELETTFTIGWDSQYVGAVVDTDAPHHRGRFSYAREA